MQESSSTRHTILAVRAALRPLPPRFVHSQVNKLMTLSMMSFKSYFLFLSLSPSQVANRFESLLNTCMEHTKTFPWH